MVHFFGVAEHVGEDFFVAAVATDFVAGAGLEEFDDAVVGVAFEEAFADMDDIDEAFFLEPHSEEFDDDFFVFFGDGGNGFCGDVFSENEVAGFAAEEEAEVKVAEDCEDDYGEGFVHLEEEVEG